MGIYEMSYKTGIRRVDHIRHVIALGKDTYSEGKISYGLVEEMCQVLGVCPDHEDLSGKGLQGLCDQRHEGGPQQSDHTGTDQGQTGLNVRIISNSEQRFISYKAIAAMAGEFNKVIQKGTAIVDVGFGSAQLPV